MIRTFEIEVERQATLRVTIDDDDEALLTAEGIVLDIMNGNFRIGIDYELLDDNLDVVSVSEV